MSGTASAAAEAAEASASSSQSVAATQLRSFTSSTDGEELCKLLKLDASDNDLRYYVREMLALGSARLRVQPHSLRDEAKSIDGRVKDLVVSEYPTFLASARCVDDIAGSIREVQRALHGIQADIDTCLTSTQAAVARIDERQQPRRRAHGLLDQYPSVLELLELPQLMESCVRNEYFDEALQLLAFARSMVTVLPGVPLVQQLFQDVERSLELMRDKLLSRLAKKLPLAEALQLVGHLRRVRLMDEAAIRESFLQCQEVHVHDTMRHVEADRSQRRLPRACDAFRTAILDTVSLYRAMFLGSSKARDLLLDNFVRQMVQSFVEYFARQLAAVRDGAQTAAAVEAAAFCATALREVGGDFSPILLEITSRHVSECYARTVRAAAVNFESGLRVYSWSQSAAGSSVSLQDAANIDHQDDGGGAVAYPPMELLEVPPLAVFVNAILEALNDLRQCVPSSLTPWTQRITEEAFVKAGRALCAISASDRGQNHSSEKSSVAAARAVERARDLYANYALPHVAECFDRIFASETSKGLLRQNAILSSLPKLQAVVRKREPSEKPVAPTGGPEKPDSDATPVARVSAHPATE